MRGYLAIAATVFGLASATPFETFDNVAYNASAIQAGNPFQGVQMYANSFYAKEVEDAVKQMSDSSLTAKARKAATTPSFYWL
jgi:cellulose 1,4-beta-cellobiosidase